MQLKYYRLLLLFFLSIVILLSGCVTKGLLSVFNSSKYPAVRKTWYKNTVSGFYSDVTPIKLKQQLLSILPDMEIYPAVIEKTNQDYEIIAEYIKGVIDPGAGNSGDTFLCFYIDCSPGDKGISLDVHYCIIGMEKLALFFQYKLLSAESLDNQAEVFLNLILEKLDKAVGKA